MGRVVTTVPNTHPLCHFCHCMSGESCVATYWNEIQLSTTHISSQAKASEAQGLQFSTFCLPLCHRDWQWSIWWPAGSPRDSHTEVLAKPGYKAELKSLVRATCSSLVALVSLWYGMFRKVYLLLPVHSSKALSYSCEDLEQPITFDLHISFHLIHIYVLLHEWWQGSWSQ